MTGCTSRKAYVAGTLLGCSVAAICGVTVLFLSRLAERFLLAIVLSIITYGLTQVLIMRRKGCRWGRSVLSTMVMEVGGIVSLTMLCVTPSLDTYLHVIGLELLPIIIARAGGALFLLFFFPGYMLLSAVSAAGWIYENRFIIPG